LAPRQTESRLEARRLCRSKIGSCSQGYCAEDKKGKEAAEGKTLKPSQFKFQGWLTDIRDAYIEAVLSRENFGSSIHRPEKIQRSDVAAYRRQAFCSRANAHDLSSRHLGTCSPKAFVNQNSCAALFQSAHIANECRVRAD
jgi:hypothetical protein